MNQDRFLWGTRRRFSKWVAATSGLVLAGGQSVNGAAQGTEIEIDSVRTIGPNLGHYCGWPTVARRSNGQLILVWSGGREQHVCPFGRVDMMRSDDQGETWTWPRTLIDGAIDDRDAGVLETSDGTLLVTTFTSLAYQPQLDKQINLLDGTSSSGTKWSLERLGNWRAVHQRLTEVDRQAELGQWMIRSTDGGITWSQRYNSIVNSPHGPIQLDDGRLIYAGKKLWTGDRAVGVCQSNDDGASWQWLAAIPVRDGDAAANYHELHAVQTRGGRLIVHIRNHNKTNDRETLQTESDDGGQTWSIPHPIGVWGMPSHLTRLRDGRLLMTYGHRRAPLGIQARVSHDDGTQWSDPMIIWGQGSSGDLGYPSTVEFDDGDLLTVWYERTPASDKAVLRQARWRFMA